MWHKIFSEKVYQYGLFFLLIFISCKKEDDLQIVAIKVEPSDLSLDINESQQLSATVTGTENKIVIWSIIEGTEGGSISESGFYQAPAHPGTFHVKATAQADPTKTAMVTVKINEVALPVSVSVLPDNVSVIADTQQQFSATLANTSNQAVEWSVDEGVAGGSISETGLYTAPSTPGTFHVVAVSLEDPAKKAIVTITVVKNEAKAKALETYQNYFLASTVSNINWTGSLNDCEAGTTPQSVKDNVIKRIHYYRLMAGLPANIVINETKSSKCQEAALMMEKNWALSHTPPDTWQCYTTSGKEAAGKSNITLGLTGPNAVTAYIRDDGSNNYFVGHRRRILFPRLKEIGTGDTPKANALWVIGDNGPTPENMPDFVAWPPKGYVPGTVVYPRWSFSIPNADFSNTTISMKGPDGQTVEIIMEELNNGSYGDRTIVWKPQGINLSSNKDLKYEVKVANVKTGGGNKDFTYEVIIFKP